MKKIILTLILAFSLFTLSACNGNDEVNELTVVFFTANNTGDSFERLRNLEANTFVDEPATPIRTGFTFEGWYRDYALTQPWDFAVDKIGDESIVLYAGWTPWLHQITYETYGGEISGVDYMTEFYSGDTGVLPVALKPGFSFVAWYLYPWVDESSTIPGDAGWQVLPDNMYEDITLYAHWEAVKVRVTFKINFPVDDQGPEGLFPVLIGYGNTIDFEQFEDTDGYTFLGWNTKSDGTGTFYENGDLFERTQRITLYGTWELAD
ncbi:Internalin-A precursor [Candidatus Izimaplasma bacterium HR1]|jgi:uncharacterized repeat protein (TIGR02543 family)|uniref:InlB B-repeat-containing protein n=1 Tax=Candidatus Izimoplasma sp. HR1 TaxID=1541959 RepID=UPI0004F5BD1E|nr:Internalin-A precursor [Candidatus Izimaplasma bacterium HR1]